MIMHMNEEIAQRAYELYVKEGRPQGRALDHWLAAEGQLRGDRSLGGDRKPNSMTERSSPETARSQVYASTPSSPAPSRLDRELTGAGKPGMKGPVR
jgi:hypothetical protein